MPVRLSDGRTIEEVVADQTRLFRPIEEPVPLPSAEQARHDEVVALLGVVGHSVAMLGDQISLLGDRMVAALAAHPVAPDVHVDAPDFDVLIAEGRAGRAEFGRYADLVATTQAGTVEALSSVVDELKILSKKINAFAVGGSGGSKNVIVDSGIISAITQPVTTIEQASTQEQRLDYDTRTDGNPVYVGNAPAGSAPSVSAWRVQRLTYDSSARLARLQVQSGIAWDNRAAGW